MNDGKASDVAEAIGKGLVSGAFGTAVMTAVQMLEMKASGREPSEAPAEAARKVLHVEPEDEQAKERVSHLVHWAYGTQWGAIRGLLGAIGMREPAASLAHFALVWGTALVMLPRLDLAPPATRWSKGQIAKDAALHLLYAAATGLAYDYLDRERRLGYEYRPNWATQLPA